MESATKQASALMLPVLYLTAFIAAFNSSVVNVAVPSIMAEMNVDAAATAWLVSGYMMVQAVMMSVFSFLSRRFNTRTLFFAASAIFCIGELGSVLAPNFAMLLCFRVIQALGGAIFIPTMMGAVFTLSPREKAGTNLAIGNAIIGAAPALSPMVCGALIGAFGWRSIFALPLILMLIMTVVGFFTVRAITPVQEVHLDIASVVLVTVTMVSFIFGASRITADLTIGLISLGISAIVGTIFVQRQNRLEEPLLSMKPLRNMIFSICCILIILCIMQNFSMSLLLPTYYQSVTQTSAAQAGILLFIPAVVMTLVMIGSGKLLDRFGAWPLIPAGFAGIVLGQILVRNFAGNQELIPVLISSVIVFASVGLITSPIQAFGLKQLPPEQNSAGVSFVNVCLQGGSAVGPALFTGILSSTAASAAAAGSDAASASAAGFCAALIVAIALAVIGLLLSVYVSRKK